MREISPFVSAKYHSKCREISLELSSELSMKVRKNKERNSRISNPRLLDNTVGRNLASDTTQRIVDRVSNYCFDICKFRGLIIAADNNKL